MAASKAVLALICVSKVTHLVTALSQDNFKCTPRTVEAAEPD